jgi:hypothetical protein
VIIDVSLAEEIDGMQQCNDFVEPLGELLRGVDGLLERLEDINSSQP